MDTAANQYQLDLGIAAKVEPAVVARPVAPQLAPKPAARRQEPEKHLDWFQVISDLSRHGYSSKAIADRIEVPKSTLLGWKQGAEPRYSEGRRLIEFWCDITGKPETSLPMVDVSCWWAYHAK